MKLTSITWGSDVPLLAEACVKLGIALSAWTPRDLEDEEKRELCTPFVRQVRYDQNPLELLVAMALSNFTFKDVVKNTISQPNRCMTYRTINPPATDFPNLP